MGDVRELKRKAPQTDLAAQVSQKLETARTRCAELDQLADAMALSVALEELGATGKLAKLNAELDTARRDVAQLEGALRLAEQRDAMAQAAIDAKGRRAQLAIMRGHADARLEAANELCTALEVGSKALARFYAETDALALALPLGLIQHAIAWHQIEIEIDGWLFPARIENIIAGEMYRHADLSRRDRPPVPRCRALRRPSNISV
jgi:hypothetical protein